MLRLYQTISLISITSTSIGALIGLDKVIISINGGEKTAKQDSILEILGTASASSMIGMTEGNQGDIIYYKTKNDIEYDIIEKRANKIYDKYHKGHVPSSQRGKGIIIADTPETAVICNEMFNNTFVDEYHLVLNIESLLLAVSNILDTKELISEERKQLEKAKNLLIELKAAYTEKKITTLSTKDNETLLFILNSFKKHQENKKSNAKKLIKEKKENV